MSKTFEQQVEEILSGRYGCEVTYNTDGNYRGEGEEYSVNVQVLPESEWFGYCREQAEANGNPEPTSGEAQDAWNAQPEEDRFVIDGEEYLIISQW